MDRPHGFGPWLKQRRKARDLTQDALAQQIGCTATTIRRIEAGTRRPSRQIAERLLHVLAIAPEDQVAIVGFARGTLPAPPPQRSTNLPVPPTRLIGRAEQLALIQRQLLHDDVRLLTLTGPPGIGKTCLSLEATRQLVDAFADGVYVVELAPIRDPALVTTAIAQVLGVKEVGAQPLLVSLTAYLRDRELLLVLDNFEHLLAAAPQISELLRVSPWLRIVATSRERLHLRAEQRYRVPPLELGAAVDLFAERACAVDADFALTAANRPTIEAICQRLDRLPLAIELCAAQVDLLAPSQILAQLYARPLDLLVDGAHDLPPQHRTLRNAIQRSYELLADEERVLFRRLGVFVGGCDLAAVETVCAWHADIPTRPLLATLHALVGKSLVRTESTSTGESRFLLLETIREFALEQLRAHGEEPVLRERHYAAYLDFVRTADSYLRTPAAASWLARLQPEQDNIRAAVYWTLDAQRYTDTAWLLIAVSGFWFHNGHWYETGQWIAQLLPQRMVLDSDLRLALMLQLYAATRSIEPFQTLERWNAEMLQLLDTCSNMHLHAAAWKSIALTYYTTDYPRAVAGWERAIACARAAGAPPELDTRLCSYADHDHLLGSALWAYANALVNQGEFEQALPMLLESRDIWQQRGSRYELSISGGTLGLLALLQGDLARAHAQLHEAVTIATEFNYQEMLGFWQPVLGFVTLYRGDVVKARTILTDSLRLCTELKEPIFLARNLTFLAEVALWEGQTEEAADWLAQSLVYPDPPIIIYEVVRLFVAARLATAQQQYPRAALLFGLAEQANSQIHHAYAGPLRAQADIALATVRAALDPAVFAEAFTAGQQLSLKEARTTILNPTAIAT